MTDFSFLFDCSPRAFVILDVSSNTPIYHNKKASELYANSENQLSLEDIFRLTPHFFQDTLEDYKKLFQLEDTIKTCNNVNTIKNNGECLLVDFTMCFMTPQQSTLLLEFSTKEIEQDSLIFDIVHNSQSPMFLANFDTEFTLLLGNTAFYSIFDGSQDEFKSHYHNSFANTLFDIDCSKFIRDVVSTMCDHLPYNRNIQINTVQGKQKWFHLNLEHQFISGSKAYLGTLFPISTPLIQTKEQEDYAYYFKAIQELSGGELFFVHAATMTCTHHSEFLKEAGFPIRMNQFPSCVFPFFHPDDVELFQEYVDSLLKGNKSPLDIRYETLEKTYSWARLTSVPIFDDNGIVTEFVVKVANIDEENWTNSTIVVDPVTQALQPDFLKERVDTILKNSDSDTSHAFMFMDLDNFKATAETLGADFTEVLLGQLGVRMKQQIRGDDVFGRVGEDRFILFLKNVSKFELLLRKANALRYIIKEPFSNGERQQQIHCSIGVSVYPVHGTTYEDLFNAAELALSRSKNRGKNMATIYKPEGLGNIS